MCGLRFFFNLVFDFVIGSLEYLLDCCFFFCRHEMAIDLTLDLWRLRFRTPILPLTAVCMERTAY